MEHLSGTEKTKLNKNGFLGLCLARYWLLSYKKGKGLYIFCKIDKLHMNVCCVTLGKRNNIYRIFGYSEK